MEARCHEKACHTTWVYPNRGHRFCCCGPGRRISADRHRRATPTNRHCWEASRPIQAAWPGWPEWSEAWEPEILKILRSGQWYRSAGNGKVHEFEPAYAKLLGAKRCLATASGTTALITALHVMGVDAGDEVIVSPYTFIATYNAVLSLKALPVFADTDPETLTIDPAAIASRITDRTRAIVPVHIFGMPCDMDPINAVAKNHKLGVVEDACQAWLAEYKGRMCGTLADLGCFSFQNSKHIPSGEGGAITGNSDELVDRCHAFHNCGQSTGTFQGQGYFTRGNNYRMQHFQAAILLQQIDKLVKQTEVRRANADYLAAQLKEIPGVTPARLPAEQPGGVASLPTALQRQRVQRTAARQVHGRASRRGHSRERRLSRAV